MPLVARCASLVTIVAMAACGSRPSPVAPPANQPAPGAHVAAPSIVLTDAVRIEIDDAWDGLGCTHVFRATLSSTDDGWRGEAMLEAGQHSAMRRDVALPRAAVARLERAVDDARAAMARAAEEPAEAIAVSSWSDDYPSGAMAFTGPTTSYRLMFTDQHRQLMLEHEGEIEDLDLPQESFEGGSPLWNAYGDVLLALGLRAWIDEACATP